VRRGPVGRPSVLRRLAAAAALLTLALALAVTIVAFLQPVLLLPLVAAGVLGTVFAGWTALVCRGRRRLVGMLIAVVAFAGTLVLVGGHTVAGMVLVVLLMAGSNAAARFALSPEDVAPPGRRVGPSGDGVLLMNPRSGGGAVARFHLAEEARRRGVRPILLEPGDDLRVLAERAIADGAEVIGVAGGDGSQAIVADVARTCDVAFVCVPAGTRNHFALDLGLDRHNVAAALDAFGEAVERRVDLARVNGRVFVNNASLGIYAAIVQSEAYRGAKLGTAAGVLPDLLGPQAPPFDLRYDGPDGTRHDTADLLVVSNNPYALRTLSGIGSRARLDRGVLGVVAVRVERPRDISALLAHDAAGAVTRHPGVRAWTAESFRAESALPIPVGLDGEALVMRPPLDFHTLPAALRVRLPLTSRGARWVDLGPPGVRRTVGALLRVFAGRSAARPTGNYPANP
jgi:diacylglycerol kinase family enzyme